MSYNLLAESIAPLNWETLQRRLKPLLNTIEVFPIPSTAPQSADALGMSITGAAASEESWKETCAIARILREEFAMSVVDLHTSLVLTEATAQKFWESVIG